MRLTLADGTSLRIAAGDDIFWPSVGFLGRAMQLRLAKGDERRIVAAVDVPQFEDISRNREKGVNLEGMMVFEV